MIFQVLINSLNSFIRSTLEIQLKLSRRKNEFVNIAAEEEEEDAKILKKNKSTVVLFVFYKLTLSLPRGLLIPVFY